MSSMMFYERIVPLNSEVHKELKYKRSADFGFARRANSVPVLVAEFSLALKHYPIVFVKGKDEEVMPLALLGLEEGHNAFVTDEGLWDADYVPAFVRRYPFVPGKQEDGREMVCFDEASGRFTHDDGEALFVEGAERSPLMEQVLGLLADYHQQASLTQQFCQRMKELDLLEASNANIKSSAGQERNLSGFWVIKEAALKELSAEQTHELVKNGAMGLIYAHLMSLNNIARIPSPKKMQEAEA